MKYIIIALKDTKSGGYLPPMYVPNIPATVRDLQEIINTPSQNGSEKPVWARHPHDFELWKLGEWDHESAETTPAHNFIIGLTTLKAN